MYEFAFLILAFTALLIFVLAFMLILGGPAVPAEQSVEEKTARKYENYSNTPIKYFTARDGVQLAYCEYSTSDQARQDTVILLHGLSATSAGLNTLAQYISGKGIHVVCPDIRGHGRSGQHGIISYIGQLEDDLVDLVSTLDLPSQPTLLGFSAGGGLALRFAGSNKQALFAQYLLLAPFISHDSSTNRKGSGSHKVGIPRLIALIILNQVGVNALNKLIVLKTLRNSTSLYERTTNYSFALMMNFRPDINYIRNIESVNQPMTVAIGSEDQQFVANEYSIVFEKAGFKNIVNILPDIDHEGMIYDNQSHKWIVKQLH